MITVIRFLGFLIAFAGLLGIISPDAASRAARKMTGGAMLYVVVLIRLAFGVVLVLAAPQTRYPMVFWVLGLVVILAALAIPLIGRQGVDSVIDWFCHLSPAWIRLWSVVAMLMGVALIWAVS